MASPRGRSHHSSQSGRRDSPKIFFLSFFFNLSFLQSDVMDGAEAGHHLALSGARRAPPTSPRPPTANRRPLLINGARRQSPEAEIKYFCLNVTFVSFAAVERDICQNLRESPASLTPPPPLPPPPSLPPTPFRTTGFPLGAQRGITSCFHSSAAPSSQSRTFLLASCCRYSGASPRRRLTTG